MALKDPSLRVVLYEGAGAEPLTEDDRFSTVHALLESGFGVTRPSVAAGAVSPQDSSPLLVLGRWGAAGPPELEAEAAVPIHFRELEPAAGPDKLLAMVETARAKTETAQPGGWKPWFPVIDYDRCTNCMQCLSFCLFGVYGVDGERRIQVQNQDNCKTNCPACSRVCPEAAIMFPKYKAGPINGDIVSDSDLQREKMKIDISSLLGGDIYEMLRNRSERAKSRFSKERDSDKALTERQKCLIKLAQSGDIPPEVLMSLPGPEEIARRAEEAAAKAKAALAPLPTP